jgi:hypothetical protein
VFEAPQAQTVTTIAAPTEPSLATPAIVGSAGISMHRGANGRILDCWFEGRQRLAAGHMFIKDRMFVDLVNELVSKKEGRPIDEGSPDCLRGNAEYRIAQLT